MLHNMTIYPDDGDYIGCESCLYDVIVDNVNIAPSSSPVLKKQSNISIYKKSEKREFPPPIPFPIHPHNDPSSNIIPCQLKRYCTEDGRLILREDKSGHHHFFRSLRSDGCLTMQLVQQVLEPSSLYHAAADDDNASEVGGDEIPNTLLEAQEVPPNFNFNLHPSPSSSCLIETPSTTVHPTRTVHG